MGSKSISHVTGITYNTYKQRERSTKRSLFLNKHYISISNVES